MFCRPAGRTADCGDQPGFGEFLVPPPPLFVGRTIFCAECGWRGGPDVRPRWTPPPRSGSRLLCCTPHTCTAETTGVTNHKIVTPSQQPEKPLSLPGKKLTLELDVTISQNRGIIFLENNFTAHKKVIILLQRQNCEIFTEACPLSRVPSP